MMIKQKEVSDRLAETRSLVDDGFKRDRLAIKDREERPARPDAWDAVPRNSLMFAPQGLEDGVVTMAQSAEDASRMAPRSIEYANTRAPQPHMPQTATLSHHVLPCGTPWRKPRQHDQDSSVVGGGDTPKVNGYTFVDDEDEGDDEPDVSAKPPIISLGPGDAYNPFKFKTKGVASYFTSEWSTA